MADDSTAGASQPPEPLRVLVVDDEPDVRLLLRLQLDNYDEVTVVGEAADGVQALDQCERLRPDTVVMDLLMPRMTGIEAIQIMQQRFAEIGVVAYTATAGEFVRREMERLGVPLLLKSGDLDLLVTNLRRSAGRLPANGTEGRNREPLV